MGQALSFLCSSCFLRCKRMSCRVSGRPWPRQDACDLGLHRWMFVITAAGAVDHAGDDELPGGNILQRPSTFHHDTLEVRN